MNRLVSGPALAAVVALASACTDTNNNIFILHNQVITTACEIPNGSGDTFVSFGTLDVTDPIPGTNFANTGYLLAAAVQNGTVATSGLPHAHIFFAQGADIELRSNGSPASNALVAALGAQNLAKRTQYFSGSVDPASTSGIGIFVIDGEQTAAIAQVVGLQPVGLITHTRLFGLLDGTTVKADPYDYPVTVCKGCLVNDVGLCSSITAKDTRTFATGGVCNKLQDANLDCCTLDTGDLQCPPQKPSM